MPDARQAATKKNLADEGGLHKFLDTTVLIALAAGVIMFVFTG